MNGYFRHGAEIVVPTDDGETEVYGVPLKGCYEQAQQIANEHGKTVQLYRSSQPNRPPQFVPPMGHRDAGERI